MGNVNQYRGGLLGRSSIMESFALVDRSRPTVREQILVLVDDRKVADEMAWEMQRKGLAVDVCEVDGDDVGARGSTPRPPYVIA
jgi:hypothetical protein